MSNQEAWALRPGQIVEYLQNNQPVVAWVCEVQSTRVRALNINQRDIKLPRSRVLPWIGPEYPRESTRQEILELLQQSQQRRQAIQNELDVMEVWSLAQEEITQASIFWFANLMWTDPEPDQVAALGRAMLQARSHFKFLPPDFEVYPAHVVEKRLEEERVAREKERMISIGKEFFKELHASLTRSVRVSEPEDPQVAENLKELLVRRIRHPEDSQTQEVWTKITSGLPQDPNLPFLLARAWGIYPEHYNFLLDQADYSWEDSWADEYSNELQAIGEHVANERRESELRDLISIDSVTTRDIDDAFTLRAHEHGYSLTLALAAPGVFWQFGSDLDRAVAHRVTSLYLPEGKSDMLPKVLAEDMFSLNQEKSRPALVFDMELTPEGELRDFQPRMDWVRLSSNRSYRDVEEELSRSSGSWLWSAWRLAQVLRSRRLQQGAVIIDQSEPVIRLERTQQQTLVHVLESPSHSAAQLIVSELMLLCNMTLASWARDEGIPLLYRTQDIVLPRDYSGIWEKPEEIYQVIRSMGGTLTETVPKPHRSIGVPAYASVTSPLRRYVDLVNQAQIAAVLKGKAPPFDQAGLERLLPFLNTRMGLVGKIQKFRPRYWKLLYFKQQCKHTTWPGVVVDDSGPVVLSLPREQILVRAKPELFGGKARIGQVFRLRLGKVDPLNNEIQVLEAWEE